MGFFVSALKQLSVAAQVRQCAGHSRCQRANLWILGAQQRLARHSQEIQISAGQCLTQPGQRLFDIALIGQHSGITELPTKIPADRRASIPVAQLPADPSDKPALLPDNAPAGSSISHGPVRRPGDRDSALAADPRSHRARSPADWRSCTSPNPARLLLRLDNAARQPRHPPRNPSHAHDNDRACCAPSGARPARQSRTSATPAADPVRCRCPSSRICPSKA